MRAPWTPRPRKAGSVLARRSTRWAVEVERAAARDDAGHRGGEVDVAGSWKPASKNGARSRYGACPGGAKPASEVWTQAAASSRAARRTATPAGRARSAAVAAVDRPADEHGVELDEAEAALAEPLEERGVGEGRDEDAGVGAAGSVEGLEGLDVGGRDRAAHAEPGGARDVRCGAMKAAGPRDGGDGSAAGEPRGDEASQASTWRPRRLDARGEGVVDEDGRGGVHHAIRSPSRRRRARGGAGCDAAPGGTEWVSQTLPPMLEPRPMVMRPRMVAPA